MKFAVKMAKVGRGPPKREVKHGSANNPVPTQSATNRREPKLGERRLGKERGEERGEGDTNLMLSASAARLWDIV